MIKFYSGIFVGIWKEISPWASFCFCAIQPLDLYRSEAEFVVVYVKTRTRSFECNFLVEL